MHMTRRRDRSRGQALPEFALVAPIFFLLVFAVIQLALLFGAQNGLVNAVRDSTRRAATYRINDASFDSTTFGGICSVVRTELDRRMRQEIPAFATASRSATVAYEWKSNNEPTGTTYFLVAHITVQYRHPLYVPLVGLLLDGFDGVTDNALRIDANEQMRIENPDIVTAGTNHTC
jgi:Flp pilus assembly protein TadG